MAVIETTTVDKLLQVLHDLEPLIREHAPEAERQRRLSAPVARELRDAGFFRMLRPRALGGLGLDPASEFRVAETLAAIDSAAAWNVQVCNASELYRGWFSDTAASEIYGSPDAIVSGAFNPPRRAVPVDGGYRVSGNVSFNSGVHNATWVLGLANIFETDQPKMNALGMPVILQIAIPADEVEIVDNWNTMGMCGTGSHDVIANDVFVPTHRAVPFAPLDSRADKYATIATSAIAGCHATVALGIARSAIDNLLTLGSKVPAYTANSLRDRSVVQLRLGQAEAKLSAARALFYQTYEDTWKTIESDGSLTMAQKSRCQLASSHAATAAAEVVDLIHSCVGASGIRNEQPFQRHFRDVHVITQHAFVSESRLESVGQIMFGLEPEWGFLNF